MDSRKIMPCEDEYEPLIHAIVAQAMADYKAALRRDNHAQIAELEKFFLSGYGQLLSWNHGELIIERCRKAVEEGEGEDGEETD